MIMIVLNIRKYKVGYEVREEIHKTNFEAFPISNCDENDEIIKYINEHRGEHVIVKSAYTPEGYYIGDTKRANFLIKKMNIKPEIIPGNKVCSIGFCRKEQKWYGWSHRAICGFGIGSIAEEGDCCTTSGWTEDYLQQHPEELLKVIPVGFRAKSLSDAKRMAIAFAESVG